MIKTLFSPRRFCSFLTLGFLLFFPGRSTLLDSAKPVTRIREVSLQDEAPLTPCSLGIQDIRQGAHVPRLIVTSLKPEQPTPSKKRKERFLQVMLPMILQVNEQISLNRERLQALLSVPQHKLAPSDKRWLNNLARLYKVNPQNTKALLHRVDIVPPSLALGQSIEESGWGKSTLAAEKNSPFGHRQIGKDGQYKLKSFDSLYEAIAAYTHNINTHAAYQTFRKERQLMREQKKPLCGLHLASSLTHYSELGPKYVKKVQKIIQQNKLSELDDARLKTLKGNEI